MDMNTKLGFNVPLLSPTSIMQRTIDVQTYGVQT